jgi:predicted nucleic acid-binding protein
MVKKVFLDTNVVLDFLLDRKTFSEYAAKIFFKNHIVTLIFENGLKISDLDGN